MRLYNIKQDDTKIPSELRERDQWICWRYNHAGKKPPVDPLTNKSFDYRDSTKWLSYESAVAAVQEHSYDGIGFVLTPEDPFSFPDLDDVRDKETGELEPWAMEIVDSFDSYTEDSPSGTGLRICVRGTVELPQGKGKVGTKPTELFVSSGYVTITGNTLPGYETIYERQDELQDFYERFCKTETAVSEPSTPLPDSILTDFKVLERCRNDVNGGQFTASYDYGDTSFYSNNASRTDYHVMRKLRYYSRCDTAQMERIFKDSALVQREKMRGRVNDLTRRAMQAAIRKGGAVWEPYFNPVPTRDKIRETLEYATLVYPWKEHAGRADAAGTDYFGFKGMLRIAHEANTLEVDVSLREYMEESGTDNYEAAAKSLTRLQDLHGWLVKVRNGGYAGATRYRIKTVSKGNHILIRELYTPPVITICDYLFAPLKGTHLFRKPSRLSKYEVNPPSKSAAMALEFIHAAYTLTGKPVPVEFVAQRLGVDTKYLKRHPLRRLIDAELIEQAESGYITPDDVQKRVQLELQRSGSLYAAYLRGERHEKSRRVREMKRLAWTGNTRYDILNETGYEWDEIAANVPEIVDYAEGVSSRSVGEIEAQERDKVVSLPFVESAGEVLTPTVDSVGMVRNLPEKSEDGVYHHGALCECWLCGPEAPEFVEKSLVAA